jgi:hypothetical protein
LVGLDLVERLSVVGRCWRERKRENKVLRVKASSGVSLRRSCHRDEHVKD